MLQLSSELQLLQRGPITAEVPPSFRHYPKLWAANNGDARILPAVTVSPPLSRRQLLIVRGDLAGYIQSFVPSRPSVSAFVLVDDVHCVLGWPRVDQRHLQSRKKTRARASISIWRKGVIAFVALRKLSRPIAAWAAWEIISRCREHRLSNGSRSSREIGNLVTSLLSRHGFALDERKSFRASIINSTADPFGFASRARRIFTNSLGNYSIFYFSLLYLLSLFIFTRFTIFKSIMAQ